MSIGEPARMRACAVYAMRIRQRCVTFKRRVLSLILDILYVVVDSSVEAVDVLELLLLREIRTNFLTSKQCESEGSVM